MAAVLLAASASSAAADASTVRHFGYFAARITPSGGDHLAEVADRTNLNWVQISDVDAYRPEVLDGCRERGCIVSTGHEFFTGCNGAPAPNCNLYPNYRERWLRLASEVGSRIGKVGAFYLLDEPQWRGASPAEVATAARTIKETFPAIPVMMVEAGPKVTGSLQVPTEVDWVGFDWYCQPFSSVRAKLSTLEGVTAPHQGLFLMPEAAPLAECGGAPGHATDAEIAALQWDYFHLAEAHPRVIGLLAFGFWTSGHGSADLPLTVAAHRQIAARVITPPAAVTPPTITPPSPSELVTLRTRRAEIGRAGYLRVTLACPHSAASGCAGRIAIRTREHRARTRRLARRRLAIPAGEQKRVRLRIRRSRRARTLRAARKRRGYRVVAVIATRAGAARAPLTLTRSPARGRGASTGTVPRRSPMRSGSGRRL